MVSQQHTLSAHAYPCSVESVSVDKTDDSFNKKLSESMTRVDEHTSLTVPAEDLSAVGDVTRELADYGRTLDDDLSAVGDITRELTDYERTLDNDLSAVGDITRELTDYERTLDNDLSAVGDITRELTDYERTLDNDLSAVGDITRELTDYERTLDDQLLLDVSEHVENFKKQFQDKLEGAVEEMLDVFGKEEETRQRKQKKDQEQQLLMDEYR